MRVHRSLGVAILLLCLAACGSRLNQENFDKIRDGMSQKEVREVLGDPVDASGAKLLRPAKCGGGWKDNRNNITVHFLNDKVVSKHMSQTDRKSSPRKED